MFFQQRGQREPFLTETTDEGFLFAVMGHVSRQSTLVFVPFPTLRAGERLVIHVNSHVFSYIPFVVESFSTLGAAEGFLS